MGRIDLTKTIGELNLMRKVLFVPPSMMASGLMARMQATHIQMALVIDEYGGTDGLVSLEDIVEMVVGDIEDEHDDEEIMIAEEADGVFVVDARADLEELAAKSARLSKWENMARMSTRSAVSSFCSRAHSSSRRSRAGNSGLRVPCTGSRSASGEESAHRAAFCC